MTNDLLQSHLDLLRHNGLVVSMYRGDDGHIADAYDANGALVLSVTAGTRKDALARLIDAARHRRPELLQTS